MTEAEKTVCCQCEARGKLTNLYGYLFCAPCERKLALHRDKTIVKNAEAFARSKTISYEEEVVRRLHAMEKNFASARVKLLHILERLAELS